MTEARNQPTRLVQRAGTLTRQAHPDWIYFLPILHFCACLMRALRDFVPGLQYLVVIWDFVMHAEFPISLLVQDLTPNYAPLAAIWIVAAGTLSWYLLSRAAEFLINKLKRSRMPANIPRGVKM